MRKLYLAFECSLSCTCYTEYCIRSYRMNHSLSRLLPRRRLYITRGGPRLAGGPAPCGGSGKELVREIRCIRAANAARFQRRAQLLGSIAAVTPARRATNHHRQDQRAQARRLTATRSTAATAGSILVSTVSDGHLRNPLSSTTVTHEPMGHPFRSRFQGRKKEKYDLPRHLAEGRPGMAYRRQTRQRIQQSTPLTISYHQLRKKSTGRAAAAG